MIIIDWKNALSKEREARDKISAHKMCPFFTTCYLGKIIFCHVVESWLYLKILNYGWSALEGQYNLNNYSNSLRVVQGRGWFSREDCPLGTWTRSGCGDFAQGSRDLKTPVISHGRWSLTGDSEWWKWSWSCWPGHQVPTADICPLFRERLANHPL